MDVDQRIVSLRNGRYRMSKRCVRTNACRVVSQRVSRMTSTSESPRRIDTSMHASAFVDCALVDVALACRLVFPLAAVVAAVADFV